MKIVLSAEIRIVETFCTDDNERVLTAQWVGGDIAAITYELLENADPHYIQRESIDTVVICGIRTRIVHNAPELGLAYIQRIGEETEL